MSNSDVNSEPADHIHEDHRAGRAQVMAKAISEPAIDSGNGTG
ncbi:MAG TPA: hypothetical protein PLR25_18420 [Planctomycetaceae bacterium]|nr:hypothetical protein [Planctomycetaceae bacterium]